MSALKVDVEVSVNGVAALTGRTTAIDVTSSSADAPSRAPTLVNLPTVVLLRAARTLSVPPGSQPISCLTVATAGD